MIRKFVISLNSYKRVAGKIKTPLYSGPVRGMRAQFVFYDLVKVPALWKHLPDDPCFCELLVIGTGV